MSGEVDSPPYSAGEIAAIVRDFLTFLTTLHREPGELRVPPPGGWPAYTAENCAGFKSDLVVEVLRNLPYLERPASGEEGSLGQIHYKSHLHDFSVFDREAFTEQEYLWSGDDDDDDDESDDDEIEVPDDVVIIAEGYESGGRTLFLNVRKGTIVEVEIRCGDSVWDLREYFEDLKGKYRRLELIPFPGREMIESGAVGVKPGEPARVVSEEEVLAQTDPYVGSTIPDVLYVQQLYRSYGWPDAFRREEALGAVRALIAGREAATRG